MNGQGLVLGILAIGFLARPAWASWPAVGWQLVAGTALGYLGGWGGVLGAAWAQAAGIGFINGTFGPILCAYLGYALGSTLGAWAGVTWVGLRWEIQGDALQGFLGASLGTTLAFAIASLTDWEWALPLSPPLASLGATLAFSWPLPTLFHLRQEPGLEE